MLSSLLFTSQSKLVGFVSDKHNMNLMERRELIVYREIVIRDECCAVLVTEHGIYCEYACLSVYQVLFLTMLK